jgi:hypothetical protein
MAAGDLVMAFVVDGQPFFPCGGCSEPPAECCLYSAAAFSAGLFPPTDLPDVIVRNGTPENITRGADASDTYYGTIPNEFYADGAVWSNADTEGGTAACLVATNSAGVEFEDAFSDTLTADNGTDDPFSMLRESTCLWAGTLVTIEEEEYFCTLEYRNEAPVSPALDSLGNPWPTKPFWMFVLGVGTLEQYFAKADPQDSPTGNYGSGAITVS